MDESPLSFTGYKSNMTSLNVKGLENVVGVTVKQELDSAQI
jgi:hypothetical protein